MATKKSSTTKKKKASKIKVFSQAFTALSHTPGFNNDQQFEVDCSIDGNIGEFNDLGKANNFAHDHRVRNPGHKVIVTTEQ